MVTREQLLERICADPDDDAARLVYADWLEEQGDPRGRYLGLMVRAGQLPRFDPQRVDLEEQARVLLTGLEKPRRGYLHSWYERGLPADLKANLTYFLQHHEHFERLPLRSLEVSFAAQDELMRLGELPLFSRLCAFSVSPILPEAIAAVLPRAPKLRALGLGHARSQPAADTRALAKELGPGIEELTLTQLEPSELAPLAAESVVGRCRSLKLRYLDPTPALEAAGVLTRLELIGTPPNVRMDDSPRFAKVTSLTLDASSVGLLGARRWALEELTLSLYDDLPEQLAPALGGVSALRVEAFRWNLALTHALGPALRELFLGDRVDGAFLAELAKNRALDGLVSLRTRGARLTDAQAAALAEGLPGLRRLTLEHARVEPGPGIRALAARFKHLRTHSGMPHG
ncbi:MAG: TIGR02996 domain-containing protein [Myxococcales bacterium]